MIQAELKFYFFLFGFFLISKPGFALESDRHQIMQMRANSADLNHQAHRGIYHGHVEVDQGTTHIRANHAITEWDLKNQLQKATLQGDSKTQAHYWSQLNPDKPLLHAYADTMLYYPKQHLIELLGHARVEQGQDQFAAAYIRYDLEHHHVSSKKMGNEISTITLHRGENYE